MQNGDAGGMTGSQRWSGPAIGSLVAAVIAAGLSRLPDLFELYDAGIGTEGLLLLFSMGIGLVGGLIAVVLGLIAVVQIRRRPNRLRGLWLAIAGLAIASTQTVLVAPLFVLVPLAVAAGGTVVGIILVVRHVRRGEDARRRDRVEGRERPEDRVSAQPPGERPQELLPGKPAARGPDGEGEPISSGVPAVGPRLSGLAVASVSAGALGVALLLPVGVDSVGARFALSPVAGGIGLALGILAYVQIGRQPDRLFGRTLAVAGAALGAAASMGLWFVLMGVMVAVPVAAVVGLIWLAVRVGRRGRMTSEAGSTGVSVLNPRLAAIAVGLAGVALPVGVGGVVMAMGTAHRIGSPSWLTTLAQVFPVAPFALGVAGLVLVELQNGAPRSRWYAAAAIGLSCLAGFVVLMLHPVMARELSGRRKGICLSNVKNLALALQMYAEDNDDRFPLSANWAAALLPYIKDEEVFRCPMRPDLRSAYAYNAALSGVRRDALADPVHIIAIFESDWGWNASGGPEAMAAEPGHLRGDNLGFADGHAAWMNRERLLSGDSDCRWAVE